MDCLVFGLMLAVAAAPSTEPRTADERPELGTRARAFDARNTKVDTTLLTVGGGWALLRWRNNPLNAGAMSVGAYGTWNRGKLRVQLGGSVQWTYRQWRSARVGGPDRIAKLPEIMFPVEVRFGRSWGRSYVYGVMGSAPSLRYGDFAEDNPVAWHPWMHPVLVGAGGYWAPRNGRIVLGAQARFDPLFWYVLAWAYVGEVQAIVGVTL